MNESIKERIAAVIKPNGKQEITGLQLQTALFDIIDNFVGDDAKIYHPYGGRDNVDFMADDAVFKTLTVDGTTVDVRDLAAKLNKSIWEKEFEVLDDYLRAKRTMVFSGDVVVENFEAGGGGADLPVGVLGDVLYHDGVDWVAKSATTLGFATQSWVTQQGYVANNDARLSDARPASDVYTWAKAVTKPTYTATEVGADMGGRLSITTEKPNYGMYMLFNQIPEGQDTSYPYGWQNVIRMLHANTQGYWTEIATSFTGPQEMHYRCMQGGTALPWRKMWHDANSNLPTVDWTAKNMNICGAVNMNRNPIINANYISIIGEREHGSVQNPDPRKLVFQGYYSSPDFGYAQIVMPEISESIGTGSLEFHVRGNGTATYNYPLTKFMTMRGQTSEIYMHQQTVFFNTAIFQGQVVIQNF